MRKVARTVVEGRKRRTVIDDRKLLEYLGPPRFEYGELESEDQTGATTGLVRDRVAGRGRRRGHQKEGPRTSS